MSWGCPCLGTLQNPLLRTFIKPLPWVHPYSIGGGTFCVDLDISFNSLTKTFWVNITHVSFKS